MKVTFRCLPELEPVLPRPVAARRGLPDWLKRMPLTAPSALADGEVKTLKQCPPLLDAMSAGFLMPLPCDLAFDGERFDWRWDALPAFPRHTPRAPLGFHVPEQAVDTPLFEADSLFLKFHNLWTIETEPGVALLVTHPVNRTDLPFRALTGLVDSDRYCDNYVHFPAAWVDRGFRGTLARGTPVAQCIPVRREALQLAFEPLSGAALERMTETQDRIAGPEGSYRRRFRAKKSP